MHKGMSFNENPDMPLPFVVKVEDITGLGFR